MTAATGEQLMVAGTVMLHSKAGKGMLHSPCRRHVWYYRNNQAPLMFS